MNNIINTLITIFIAVIAFTAIYKILPFRVHRSKKPKLSFFPKYSAKFNKSINDIESSLSTLGFKKNENNILPEVKFMVTFQLSPLN